MTCRAPSALLLAAIIAVPPLLRATPDATAPLPLPDQPLEFRGIVEENDRRLFSVFDAASRRSNWVQLHQPVDGIAVQAYDDATQTIVVKFQAQLLTLPLKGAKRAAGPSVTPLLAPALAARPNAAPAENIFSDRPFRLGHVAEETLIRRAVRREAAAPATTAAGPSSGHP